MQPLNDVISVTGPDNTDYPAAEKQLNCEKPPLPDDDCFSPTLENIYVPAPTNTAAIENDYSTLDEMRIEPRASNPSTDNNLNESLATSPGGLYDTLYSYSNVKPITDNDVNPHTDSKA